MDRDGALKQLDRSLKIRLDRSPKKQEEVLLHLKPTMVVCSLAVLASVLLQVDAFVAPSSVSQRTASPRVRLSESFGDSLLDTFSKLPFGRQESSQQSSSTTALPPPPFQPTPEGVIQRAKLVLACDLGVQDESLLDPAFIWIGSNLGSRALSKTDYLAAGKFFDLRAAFPDLDYRAHDFRIDEKDPMTVRVTARTVGTMRGELRLRNEVLPPNGKQMRCPPEAISMTFDKRTGRLVKLCSGFVMDRLAGNTGGLCGVMGAAAIAGKPPSEWEMYPATTVVKRFFGRPDQQVDEATSFLAPFPETVMIQLAKGIFSADMAVADPDLLAPSFTYYGRYDGPIKKDEYLEKYAAQIFDGLDLELSYLRVDPYDPYRVWVDVRPSGTTSDGVYVDAPPAAFSFTFDDEGFCIRMTGCAVMDPSIGNTGGLCGAEGILYAAGKSQPGIANRPLPEALERVRKLVLSPITKVGVDEYSLGPSDGVSVAPSKPSPNVQKALSPVEKAIAKRPSIAIPKFSTPVTRTTPSEKPRISEPKAKPQMPIPFAATLVDSRKPASEETAEKKAEEAVAAREAALEVAKQRKAELAADRAEATRLKAEAAKRKVEIATPARGAQLKAAELERQRKAEVTAEKAKATKAIAEEAAAARQAKQAQAAAEAAKRSAEQAALARQARADALEAVKAERIKKARADAEAALARQARADALEAEQQKKRKIFAERAAAAERKAEKESAARKARLEKARAAERAAAAKRAERVQSAKKSPATSSGLKFSAPERPTISIFGTAEKKAAAPKPARKVAPAPAPRPTLSLLGLTGEAPKPAPKQASKAAPAPSPRPSLSLLGLGGAAPKPAPKQARPSAAQPPRPSLSLLGLTGSRPPEVGPKAAPAPSPRPTLSLLGLGSEAAPAKPAPIPSPRPSLSLQGMGGAPKATPKKEAPKSAPAPAPRSTFSIFGLGGSAAEATPSSPASVKEAPPKRNRSPPRGVPSLERWRKNRDRSVTGYIYGSSQFEEGAKVTTSPISDGEFTSGTVVKTKSGSRYFLS